MIFKTSKEIAEITGSYYANNNFDKLSPFISAAYTELSQLIGADTIAKADDIYIHSGKTDSEKELLRMIQRPVALRATLELYRHNDMSHQDSGRVRKVDNENEKIPWEWQLQRDDEIALQDYYGAVDALMAYLDLNKIDTWLVQKSRLRLKELLLNNAFEFSLYWPDMTPRIFMQIAPYIRESQRRWLKPAMSADNFEIVLTAAQNGTSCEYLEQACNALALHTMALAFSRGMYSLIPQGIIQRGMNASGLYKGDAVSLNSIKEYTRYLYREADSVLDDMKVIINGGQTYNLTPNNSANNKYMKV